MPETGRPKVQLPGRNVSGNGQKGIGSNARVRRISFRGGGGNFFSKGSTLGFSEKIALLSRNLDLDSPPYVRPWAAMFFRLTNVEPVVTTGTAITSSAAALKTPTTTLPSNLLPTGAQNLKNGNIPTESVDCYQKWYFCVDSKHSAPGIE